VYEGSQWLNQKVITCAIKLWPVVVVDGSMLRCRGVFVRDLLKKLKSAIFVSFKVCAIFFQRVSTIEQGLGRNPKMEARRSAAPSIILLIVDRPNPNHFFGIVN